MRNFRLLLAAIVALIIGSIVLILIKQNINDDNARYLLSVIPQVIGTVFVLTVAFMQAFGGSEFFDIKRLIHSFEFKLTAGVSFFGMTVPLFVLYFNSFCILPSISLCLFISNLLVIAWFIFSVAPEQAIGKSLSRLKKEASDSLGIPSDIIPILKKIADIAIKNILNNILITKDSCKLIRGIILATENRQDSIWDKAIELLINIDKTLRNKKKIDASEEVTIPYIQYLSVFSKFNENCGWSKIKDYLFGLFHNDIQIGNLDLDKPISTDKQDAFIAIKTLISATKGQGRWELFDELLDFLINKLKNAMTNKSLKRKYKKPAFVFIFNTIVEIFSVRSMRLDTKYKQKLKKELSEFAEIVNESLSDLFNNDTRNLVPINKIFGLNSEDLLGQFDEVKKEFETKT